MRKPTPVAPSGLLAAAAAATTPTPATPADSTAGDGAVGDKAEGELDEEPAYTGRTVPVRILRNERHYVADQVADLPEHEVDAARAAGWADDHEDAVAYARSLEG